MVSAMFNHPNRKETAVAVGLKRKKTRQTLNLLTNNLLQRIENALFGSSSYFVVRGEGTGGRGFGSLSLCSCTADIVGLISKHRSSTHY